MQHNYMIWKLGDIDVYTRRCWAGFDYFWMLNYSMWDLRVGIKALLCLEFTSHLGPLLLNLFFTMPCLKLDYNIFYFPNIYKSPVPYGVCLLSGFYFITLGIKSSKNLCVWGLIFFSALTFALLLRDISVIVFDWTVFQANRWAHYLWDSNVPRGLAGRGKSDLAYNCFETTWTKFKFYI